LDKNRIIQVVMKGMITFTREGLDDFTKACNDAKAKNESTFVWKGTLNKVSTAEHLIERLERSPNLSTNALY
jgi:hypothetical protein